MHWHRLKPGSKKFTSVLASANIRVNFHRKLGGTQPGPKLAKWDIRYHAHYTAGEAGERRGINGLAHQTHRSIRL